MAAQLDWSQCPVVESIPGKVSGAWVLKEIRMSVQTLFENMEACLSAKKISEVFDVTEEEEKGVLHFAVQSWSRLRRSDEDSVRHWHFHSDGPRLGRASG